MKTPTLTIESYGPFYEDIPPSETPETNFGQFVMGGYFMHGPLGMM